MAAPPVPAPQLPTPQLSVPQLTGAQVQRTMRLSVVEGSFSIVFINWTTGSVLTGYAIHLGAGDTALGLIASVPLLAQAVSPLAAWLVARRGRRRGLTTITAAVGRGLWLLTPFIAALPGTAPGTRAAALLLVVAVSSLFLAANSALWSSWIGDVVPWKQRGRYFGLRTGIHGVVGTVANLLAGVWLDRVAAPLNFWVVLAVAAVMGLLAAALMYRHDEPPIDAERLPIHRTITLPLSDDNFRRLLLFGVYWTFAVLLASPFVIPYFLKHLHMSYLEVAVWGTISAGAALVLAPNWGRLTDRAGNKPVLAVCTFLAGTLLPGSWMLAAPGRLWPIWVAALMDALVWSAINPGLFNLSLASTPAANRSAFIAVFSAATGLAGFLGGLLSGPLLAVFRSVADEGAAWSPYHWLFLTSGLLRTLAWTLLRRVREPDSWRTRRMLRYPGERLGQAGWGQVGLGRAGPGQLDLGGRVRFGRGWPRPPRLRLRGRFRRRNR